jgi:hypothetical protein
VRSVATALRIAQTLERDRDLDNEAIVDPLTDAVIQGIPRIVATGC